MSPRCTLPQLALSATLVTALAAAAAPELGAPRQPMDLCAPADVRDAPWCKLSSPFGARAAAIVANLTIEEKAGLFLHDASAIPRIHWPAFNWWSEALHGVARLGMATSWPQVLGVAASFDRELFWQLGNLTSTEARGKAGGVGHTYWAPNVNIFRDPRWGRGQETPGEDPVLTSAYAEAFITAMQGDHPRFLKTSAGVKHFLAYSQETDREGIAVNVSMGDMVDTYLPAFAAAVVGARASGLMCSYNAESFGYGVLGPGAQGGAVPSCANRYALHEIAREAWQLNGYIVSDCYAVNRVSDRHHYAANGDEAIFATLAAGMDLECGNTMGWQNMDRLYRSNATIAAMADKALAHLFEVQLRLGWADPPSSVPWSGYGQEVVDTREHRALAKTAADRSLVLLKNSAGALPWSRQAPGGRRPQLVVLGPHANATTAMQGNYNGDAPFLVSPCEGLGAYAEVRCFAPPLCKVSSARACWGAAAEVAIAQADAVVLAVGLDQSQEAEGFDRKDLLLPGGQDELMELVAAAASKSKKPLALVVLSGSALDIAAAEADARVGAIVWCGYPGQAGGSAIADALFGATNSFGRLPVTWYANSFTQEARLDDYAMRPDPSRGYPGRTHRFYTGRPLYPFGHGLRYSAFECEMIAHTIPGAGKSRGGVAAEAAPSVVARAMVRNAGERTGDEVLLLFGRPPSAGARGRPLQVLLDFTRLRAVAPGERRAVTFSLNASAFELVDEAGQSFLATGRWRMWLGPPLLASLAHRVAEVEVEVRPADEQALFM